MTDPHGADSAEIERLERLLSAASPLPWEFDCEPNEDGEYGPGPDPGRGLDDYMIIAAEGGKIMGTEDATHKSIDEEFDEDGNKTAWDMIGRANAELATTAVNALPALLAALRTPPDDAVKLREAWKRVSLELDNIPGGMHAGLEDAVCDLWGLLDDRAALKGTPNDE